MEDPLITSFRNCECKLNSFDHQLSTAKGKLSKISLLDEKVVDVAEECISALTKLLDKVYETEGQIKQTASLESLYPRFENLAKRIVQEITELSLYQK